MANIGIFKIDTNNEYVDLETITQVFLSSCFFGPPTPKLVVFIVLGRRQNTSREASIKVEICGME